MKKLICISFPSNKYNGIGFSDVNNQNNSLTFVYCDKSKLALLKNFFRIIKLCIQHDVIIINYISLFLLFGPISRLLFKKVVFIPHEGEPLFPKALKKEIPFPRVIISSLFLTKICIFIAHDTYSLSRLQAKLIGANTDTIIHLGVDPSFVDPNIPVKQGCFFPNRKTELIKGYGLISECHHVISNHNDSELSSAQMAAYYNASKVVVVTSLIETYSYCMVEAMQANCIVLTTKGVGLTHDLLHKFGEHKLNKAGIFIFDNASELSLYLINNFDKLHLHHTTTKDLALEFGLSGEAASRAFKRMELSE